ncbi:putative damage-inducible protein DinB [Bacillus pakistanensis]|uniref:Damage-inducible protein DinB n=1 Tax=Rossellomorea pakistanensis TaxID=992288 RepID=A0ABS2NGQ9_9BACI|nr:DinB family protein [Bacillus pakistanensis]MBM7587046.1 putative damage-inducible protein DinB [Bacillus pakistanensis]
MSHHALEMYDYHVWANNKIITKVKELPEDIYSREIPSVFPSISKVLSHIYVVDYGWFQVMKGEEMKGSVEQSIQLLERTDSVGIDEMERLFIDLSESIKVFLNQQEDLEKLIDLDNPYAGKRDTSLAEMVYHVVNHGTYHRGNITAMLRQMGHASVMTDYAYYWYSK